MDELLIFSLFVHLDPLLINTDNSSAAVISADQPSVRIPRYHS